MIILIIFFTLNIVMTVAIYNEGSIVPEMLATRTKALYYIGILLVGCLMILALIFTIASQPLIVRAKWIRRQRKIRKAILNRAQRDQPRDIGIGIF